MTNEVDALHAELAALRQDLEDLRVAFPEALLEGDLATERVTFMNRLACQVFRCSAEDVFTMTARDIFAEGDYQRAQIETRERLERGFADGGGARYVRTRDQDLREFTMRRSTTPTAMKRATGSFGPSPISCSDSTAAKTSWFASGATNSPSS